RDVGQLNAHSLFGGAEPFFANNQDALAGGLLLSLIENRQVGIRLVHGSNSSKDPRRHIAPHPQSRQQEGVGQQLLRPVRRRLLYNPFHDSPSDHGQPGFQRQAFGQAAEHRQRYHPKVGGQ